MKQICDFASLRKAKFDVIKMPVSNVIQGESNYFPLQFHSNINATLQALSMSFGFHSDCEFKNNYMSFFIKLAIE